MKMTLLCLVALLSSLSSYADVDTFPLELEGRCQPKFIHDFELQLHCALPLRMELQRDDRVWLTSSGDLYFEYNYYIIPETDELLLVFTDASWVDDDGFYPGDELRFKKEVLTHFKRHPVTLTVSR